MTKAEFVAQLLSQGQANYIDQGKPPEYFIIDLVLDWKRLSDKERHSLKAKRKAKKEAAK